MGYIEYWRDLNQGFKVTLTWSLVCLWLSWFLSTRPGISNVKLVAKDDIEWQRVFSNMFFLVLEYTFLLSSESRRV